LGRMRAVRASLSEALACSVADGAMVAFYFWCAPLRMLSGGLVDRT
jgi:hypothetical protein